MNEPVRERVLQAAKWQRRDRDGRTIIRLKDAQMPDELIEKPRLILRHVCKDCGQLTRTWHSETGKCWICANGTLKERGE